MSERRLHIPNQIREIVLEPNWYDRMGRLRGSMLLGAVAAGNLVVVAKSQGSAPDRAKLLMLRVFEQLLAEDAVMLGEAGPNWDAERHPIDTVVIHHTGSAAPMPLSRLNAMHLLRLYVPKYQHPGPDAGLIGGTPIYSGHSDVEGNQVFYGYHWLVRRDGKTERLLPDEAIGWHAGNWDANTRSIAICFDDDLEHGQPAPDAMDAAAELIATGYPQVPSAQIIGHNAITQTVCPGGEFNVWGAELRALVEASRR